MGAPERKVRGGVIDFVGGRFGGCGGFSGELGVSLSLLLYHNISSI